MAGCTHTTSPAAKPGPALPEHDIVVDGTTITAREIAAELQYHPSPTAEEAWEAAARALVVRRLLLDAAAAAGIVAEDEEAMIDGLLAQAITLPAVDDAAARRWLAAHPERFGATEAWDASHILIAADPDDEAERTAAKEKAAGLLAQVLERHGTLPDLARVHSACPSREQGGHLGQVARGTTVPEFEAALATLSAGEVCPEVVPSRYGMHVIRLHAHAPATRMPFEEVAGRVMADLRSLSWRQGVRQYVAVLASRARIEGFDLEGIAGARADGPLVN